LSAEGAQNIGSRLKKDEGRLVILRLGSWRLLTVIEGLWLCVGKTANAVQAQKRQDQCHRVCAHRFSPSFQVGQVDGGYSKARAGRDLESVPNNPRFRDSKYVRSPNADTFGTSPDRLAAIYR
jgi:hypothetical protein